MKRTLVIFAMMCALVAGAGLSLGAFAQGDKGGAKAGSMAGCQKECHTCASVCEKTLSYCQKQGGKHNEAKHTNTITDCISLCKMSDDFMGRSSELSNKVCGLCKESCLKCAESCETFKGDKTMKNCADECRKCAHSCDKMAS